MGVIDINNLFKPVGDIANKALSLIPDPNQAAQLKSQLEQEILTASQAVDIAQNAVNEADAKSGNPFQSYWRPLAGWVSVIGITWAYVLQPISIFFLKVFGYTGTIPEINTDGLLTLLLGLLGMGTLRTVDKIQGTAK